MVKIFGCRNNIENNNKNTNTSNNDIDNYKY